MISITLLEKRIGTKVNIYLLALVLGVLIGVIAGCCSIGLGYTSVIIPNVLLTFVMIVLVLMSLIKTRIGPVNWIFRMLGVSIFSFIYSVILRIILCCMIYCLSMMLLGIPLYLILVMLYKLQVLQMYMIIH